ncbi:unnamed protein product [Meganyctiphanes norvegica]|uniref:Oplophorus-luciferin 2-monooxygenase non-catalytic subunit n=1 Tax=Meganyctiphanes norvegica TaxID=48144 RepID=A0AAV2Q226_MEGNR
MQSHIIILLYIGVACVSGQDYYCYQYPTHSDAYNVKQDDHHLPEYYGYEPTCPDAEDIAPCVCTYVSGYKHLYLECSAVENEEQLKQIFEADFPTKNFKEFRIEQNNNLKVLEAGVFNGISFDMLYIMYNKLEVIELQALDSCYETTIELHLYGNNITSFPFDEVSQFSKLCYFSIGGNSLSVIPADVFNGITALKYIYLSENKADIVGTFQDLPNLRDLYLYSNALTTIPADFVKTGSSNLSYIPLHYNNIVSVEPGAFDLVDGLDIYLGYNPLSTLDEATWRPHLEAGGLLFAPHNPLVCDCDIAWLFGEDQLLEQVGDYTACSDGERLHDLDPSMFDNC